MPGEYYLPEGPVTSYNNVLMNQGERFDGNTGVFEAPHSGLYEFSLDGNTKADYIWGEIQLLVNSKINKIFQYEANKDDGMPQHFNGIYVLQLLAFDQVQLNVTNLFGGPSVKGSGNEYFLFTGQSL